jgi:uncharacterized protein
MNPSEYLTRASKTDFDSNDGRRLSFYAAIFDAPARVEDWSGMYTEVIKPGAFASALADTSTEVIATVSHDEKRTFAKRSDGSLLIQEDPKGLYASCWLPETELGDQILRRVKAGELNGCSFQFRPIESKYHNGMIERRRVELADVCLTGNPLYPQTKGEVLLRSEPTADPDKVRYLIVKAKLLLSK